MREGADGMARNAGRLAALAQMKRRIFPFDAARIAIKGQALMTTTHNPSNSARFSHFVFAGFAALAVLLLSGCVSPMDSGMGYDPVNRYNYSGANPDTYRLGYQYGRQDARDGLSHNYVRHSSEFNSLTKSQFVDGYMKAYTIYRNNGGGGTNYTASIQPGQVRILQNGRTVSVVRSELPNVERYQFKDGKNKIVVKSRGNHGPAVVELFDSKTGNRRGRVMAYEIANGQPAWARGMKD